jgi:PAS domain S-box-containing protein
MVLPEGLPDAASAIEHQLRAGERRYRTIVQSSLDAIVTIDQHNRITEFNPAAEEIFGRRRQDVIGRDLGETIIPPQFRQAHRAGLQRHLRSERAPRVGLRLELQALRADGSLFPVELTVTRVADEDMVQFTAFIRDLTQQRRAEEQALRLANELAASERVLATLLANLPGMAYRCAAGPGWPLEFVSEGALALCGYTAGDLVGRAVAWRDLVRPDDLPGVLSGMYGASERTGRFELTYRIRTATGEEKWVRDQGTATTDVAGNTLGIEGLVIDVTAEYRAKEEIDRMNRELEERVGQRTRDLQAANSELEAFSYSIAHDLRSPLTSIDGFTRALLETQAGRLDASGTHYLNRVRNAVRHMSELTDAMLSLASVTRGQVRCEAVDLAAAARTVLEQLAEADPARKTRLDVPGALWVQGDTRLLQQVIANLVGNAWKFSAGREETYIRLACEQDAQGETVYLVQDRGAGFDMAHARRLFGAFERLHSQAEFHGTGIGLAIVQKIVQRHDGRIWAHASPQGGATFYFTLGARA